MESLLCMPVKCPTFSDMYNRYRDKLTVVSFLGKQSGTVFPKLSQEFVNSCSTVWGEGWFRSGERVSEGPEGASPQAQLGWASFYCGHL